VTIDVAIYQNIIQIQYVTFHNKVI